jgi:two-component system repressor protein LuxO
VRELENVIRNVVVLNGGKAVDFDMLPMALRRADAQGLHRQSHTDRPDGSASAKGVTSVASAPLPTTEIRPLWLEEKEVIERAIRLCDGNVPKAAALLEISASTVYRKRATWEKAEEQVHSDLS